MSTLRLSEIDELMLDDDELDEIQLRRKLRKEKKEKPYVVKISRVKVHEPIENGDDLDSTGTNKWKEHAEDVGWPLKTSDM